MKTALPGGLIATLIIVVVYLSFLARPSTKHTIDSCGPAPSEPLYSAFGETAANGFEWVLVPRDDFRALQQYHIEMRAWSACITR